MGRVAAEEYCRTTAQKKKEKNAPNSLNTAAILKINFCLFTFPFKKETDCGIWLEHYPIQLVQTHSKSESLPFAA